MPQKGGRKRKPARLWFRADAGVWIILDGKRQVRTGCARDQITEAAHALEEHIGANRKPAVSTRDPVELEIADVLDAYQEAKKPAGFDQATKPYRGDGADQFRQHDNLIDRIGDLNAFFGSRKVAEIKSQLCRDFVDWCTGSPNERNIGIAARAKGAVSDQTARRQLEDLRAAIRLYHADHMLTAVPKITLPAKAESRQDFLTRPQAARLLGAAIGFVWDASKGTWARQNGGLVRRDRMTRTWRRHAARFILIGLYSGRREATIRRTQWMANATGPWFDLANWVYHGRGREERNQASKKRRPRAKVANRLRPHLARWKRSDDKLATRLGRTINHVIHQPDGDPLNEKIKTAWIHILGDAGLGREFVRHTLKHTAATWLMQLGTDHWSAAGFLGITVKQLEDGYGHHHPDFQEDAAGAFSKRASS